MMATAPYFPPQCGDQGYFDLPLTVVPWVLVNGHHYLLEKSHMATFASFLQHYRFYAQEILGEPPAGVLTDMEVNSALQYMKLVYRVTSVDKLEMIWNLTCDHILDQRLAHAIGNSNFPHSIGLHPKQLYIQVLISPNDYLLARATLNRPRLPQGIPMFGPYGSSNLSSLARLQDNAVSIQVEHQNRPQAPSNVSHMVEPPNGGQFIPASTAGPIASLMPSPALMNPQMPQRQGQRGEPEGYSSTYVSMEEEHVAVNSPERVGLNTSSIESGEQTTEADNREIPNGNNPRCPPGIEVNQLPSAESVPQVEQRGKALVLYSKQVPEQDCQHQQVEMTMDIGRADNCEHPPSSPLQEEAGIHEPRTDGTSKDRVKRKRSSSRSKTSKSNSKSTSTSETPDQRSRDDRRKEKSQSPGEKLGNGQQLKKAEEGAGINCDSAMYKSEGQSQTDTEDHGSLEDTVNPPQEGNVGTPGNLQVDNQTANENKRSGKACKGRSITVSVVAKKCTEKDTNQNAFEKLDSVENTDAEKELDGRNDEIVSQQVQVQFQLYISQEYGKIKGVEMESTNRELANIPFYRDETQSRIWKSCSVLIPINEDIRYTYKIQGKEGAFVRFLKYLASKPDTWEDQEIKQRQLKLCAVRRDVYKGYHATHGHVAFMSIMFPKVTKDTVKEDLVSCKDMGFPKKYDGDLTVTKMLDFVEKQLKNVGTEIRSEQCVFLVTVLAYGVGHLMYSNKIKKKTADTLLNGLVGASNSLLPSDAKVAVRDIAVDLCEMALDRVCWVDILHHFHPLLDNSQLLHLKPICHSPAFKELSNEYILHVVKKMCEVPESEELLRAIIPDATDVSLTLDIYSYVTQSNKFCEVEKEKLVQAAMDGLMKLIKAECLKASGKYRDLQALKYTAQLLSKGYIEVAEKCTLLFESHIVKYIDNLQSELEGSTKVNGELMKNISNLALQSWLFQDGESAFRLILTLAKSWHKVIHHLALELLDQQKFRILEESHVRDIAVEWMETCRRYCGSRSLRLPRDVCNYYQYLVQLLPCDLLVQHGNVATVIEGNAKEILLKSDVARVLYLVDTVSPETQTKLFDHAAEVYEDVPLTESLLGSGEIVSINNSKHASMILTALNGTNLALQKNVNSLEMALGLAQNDILNYQGFWQKLLNAQGSMAKKVQKSTACQNMKKALSIIAKSVEDGTIAIKDFKQFVFAMKKYDETKSIRFIGENQGDGGVKTVQWEAVYKTSCLLEGKCEAILTDLECLFPFLHKISQDEFHLIDIADLENKTKQCREIMTIKGGIPLKSLNEGLTEFLGPLADLCSESRILNILKKSEVFLNICRNRLVYLEPEQQSTENSFAVGDLQGASLLFGDSDENLDASPEDEMLERVTCKCLAEYLSTDCGNQYSNIFHGTMYQKKDLTIMEIKANFPDLKKIPKELDFAETYFQRKLPPELHRAFDNFLKFEDILGKTETAEEVLKVFSFNDAEDLEFKKAISVARKFRNVRNHEVMSLFEVSLAYEQIVGAFGKLGDDHWSLLKELSRSSKLIAFLKDILEEDLRNLVDAVEDSPDQQIQSTTVYDFIQVKQFVKSIVKGLNSEKVKKVTDFFLYIKKAAGIPKETQQRKEVVSKDMAAKVKICNSNFYGLQTLYCNMANRGEVTREIIHNALNNGVIHFEIDSKLHECHVRMRYSVRKEKASYDDGDLEDLRSRAFLLLGKENTQGKQGVGEVKKRYIDFQGFIDMVDLIMDVKYLVETLHNDGHFDFRHLAKNVSGSKQEKQENLRLFCDDLTKKLENWRKVLQNARSEYYFLNFVYAEQFMILNDFFLEWEGLEKVAPIFRSIHPDIDVSSSNKKNLVSVYHAVEHSNKELGKLVSLGEALKEIFGKMMPRQRQFPEIGSFGNQDVTAVVPVNHVYVVKLDADSQNVIPVIMSLYAATCHALPESWQLMFCHEDSSWDEIDLLLKRCKYAGDNSRRDALFCLANVEYLGGDYLLRLIDELKKMAQLGKDETSYFRLAVVCRGPMHHPLFDHFSQDTHTVRGLPDRTVIGCLEKMCSNVTVVTSEVPGLGKSEFISNKAAENEKQLAVMTVSGPITRAGLVKRLSETNVEKSTLLHLDISDVSDCELLDVFIFELVVMYQVSYRTNLVQLPTDFVAIEISNTLHQYLEDSLIFTTRLVSVKLMWEDFKNFYCDEDEVLSAVQVVCHYLQALESGNIDRVDLLFRGPKALKPLPMKQCRYLLGKHFGASGDVSFAVCDIFLRVLAQQLRKMSSSVYFSKTNLEAMLGTKEPLQVRSDLVRALIQVCSEFACRSVSSCRASQEAAQDQAQVIKGKEAKAQEHLERQTTADWMAHRTQGMIRWEESNHLMIVFHHDGQTVSALYRELQKVPKQIQSLFKKQLGDALPNFDTMNPKQLQHILEKLAIGRKTEQNKNHLQKLWSVYALTPDNLLKMVLILLRIQACIPVVIMGETGCGKTSLVRYLAATCGIQFNDSSVIPFHAGITEKYISEKIWMKHKEALKNLKTSVWVFLDEINTCEHLGLLCEIICHHSYNGKPLADNLTFVAACNPYRLRENLQSFTAGLEGKIKADESSKLVYRVHPLPEAMIDYVWDYGTLHEKDEKTYIVRMVSNTLPSYKPNKTLVEVLAVSQEFMRNTEATVECVSLRDVDRCRRLMTWFHDDMLEEKAKFPISHRDEMYTKSSTPNMAERAIILALAHCYHSRIGKTELRKEYLKRVARVMFGSEGKSNLVSETIFEEQMDLLNRMELPDGIAKNTALRENVFVVLVCILRRIPVFVVGKPGSSKSLSLQLLRSNLRGQDSDDAYFKILPQLLVVSYQGSESSTSEGIIKVFEKAKSYSQKNENVLPVVLLDEIGLAEISRFNPLKVLHNLLEPVSGKDPEVAVVGLSNWALDAAKMNRAIHLSRPELDAEELLDTGISISTIVEKSCWLSEESQKKLAVDEYILEALSIAFYEYQKSQTVKNFHGLRDYYSLIKYLSKHLREEMMKSFKDEDRCNEIIKRGILRNFGGQESQVNDFLSICFHHFPKFDNDIAVEELIHENLVDKEARHLMVITSGGSAMGVLEKIIREQNRECETIIGSMFDEDQTEDYSYRILSRIIMVMERGCVLILKDLDTIYGSLYDMLNQNYTRVGGKRNCRIALGPFSNPMCHVHEDFRCIVLVDEHKVDYSDPPFLNRFEKQIVRYGDVLTKTQKKLLYRLENWVHDASTVEDLHFSPEDCFVGYNKDTLPTLVLHNSTRELHEDHIQETMKICKETLLWTAAPAAVVRLTRTKFGDANPEEVENVMATYFHGKQNEGLPCFLEYLRHKPYEAKKEMASLRKPGTSFIKQPSEEVKEKMTSLEVDGLGYRLAVYTNSHLLSDYRSYLPHDLKIQVEKLSSFKSERQLTLAVRSFWFESEAQLLMLHCKPSLDAEHLQLAKYQIENCRSEFLHSGNHLYTNKDVCIVVHLDHGEEKVTGQWQFNYLSGWQIVTLDDLEPHRDGESLLYILESNPLKILQSHALPVRKCLEEQMLWAFSCLKHSNCPRAPKETTELIKLICKSDELMDAIIRHVLLYLFAVDEQYQHRRNFMSPESWQAVVSCDASLLSYAATFRSALLSSVTRKVQVPLAKLVFMLDSVSAWHSFFTNLELTEVWKELFNMESWFSTQNVEDPHGLECYHVQDPPLKLIYPFSKVLYKKLEAHLARVQEDLDKMFSDAEAVNQFSDLKPEYQDRLAEQFVEFFKNKAPELFNMPFAMDHVEHLINDFCNIVSELYHVNLVEDTRITVCKWIIEVKNQSSQVVGEYRLVASLLTLWRNQSLMEDVLQLLAFCKSAIRKDTHALLWGALQEKFEDHETDLDVSKVEEILHDSHLHETDSEIIESTASEDHMETAEEESADTAEIDQDGEDLLPEEILVNNLCSELIPCEEVLNRCGGVNSWQMMVNRLLSFASRISAYPCSLHVLRLCNDYVSMIHLPYNLDEGLLLCLAEKAQKGLEEGLDSPELFKCIEKLMETLGEEGVPWEETQRFQLQYFGRILDVNAQSDLLSEILATVVSLLDRGRELFVSPILHRLMIYLDNEDHLGFYQRLMYVSPSEADMAEYPSLECLKGHLESAVLETRKKLMILCSDVLQMLLKPRVNETLADAVEGDHHLLKAYDKAARILTHETEPSLSAAVATGFISALHDKFAAKLAKGSLTAGFSDYQVLTNTVSNALQFGPNEEDPVRRILLNHFLQLIRLRREFGVKDLTDAMSNMSAFVAGKSLPPPVDEVVLSVGYNPLSLVPNFLEHRQAIDNFLNKGEEKDLVILVSAAKSSSIHCLALLANAMDKFYLVRALRPLKKGEKSNGKKICQLAEGLPATVQVLLKCLVGEEEFCSSLLEISPESNIQQVQKAVVLLSYIGLITASYVCNKEEEVNRSLFAKCLLDPKQLLDSPVPTCTDAKCPTMTQQLQTWRSIQDCQVFRCKCNRQTCVALGKEMCSTCQTSFLHEEVEVGSQESGLGPMDTSEYQEIPGSLLGLSDEGCDTKMCIRKLSAVSFRILRLLLHGILEGSVALGITPSDELSQILGLSQPQVKTFMEDMISLDWHVLQGQLDVSHEDLFHLLNCLIWKMQDMQGNTCSTAQERDTFEEEFDKLTKSVIAVRGEVCVQHFQDVTKLADFRSGGIESMMFELPLVEKEEKSALPLLSAFRQIHDKSYENFASQFLSLDLGHKFPFLELYLDYQEQLSLLCNILPIVRWHLKLVACGSHTLRRGDAIQWTAAKFTHLEEQDKHSRKTVFDEFCQAWGRLCDKWSIIQAIDPGVGEPRRRHEGIELRECILETKESDIFKVLLVLQKIQNEFLEKSLKIASATECLAVSFLCAEPGISQLPVVPLQSAITVHVVDTVWEESILRYAQWDTRYGYGKILKYNFGKIEEELANLLVLGKAYLCLDASFPLFNYAGELFRSSAGLIDGLKEVIPQRILPPKIQDYVHQVRNSNPEYPRDLLHNLEVIMYFLRKFEPRKDITVQDFIDKWLEGTMAQSAKVELPSSEFELLCVCHVVSLLEFLEELQGHAIIESLPEKFRKGIPGHLEEKLTAFEKNNLYPQSSLVVALKRFIFRWLPTLEKQKEMDELEPLGQFLDDVTLWPHRIENEGLLRNEDVTAFHSHFPKELTLQHLYCILQRVNTVSEEKKKAEKLAAPVYRARPGRRARTKGGQFGRT